jgi:S1-C subfamily serine protease
VTSGIISAVDRPYPNSEIVVGMLQTDAPINSGNSGGALVNRYGQVIGINTAIFSNSGDNSGIGFAIPVGVAHAQAQKIIKGESLETGFLGIEGNAPPGGESGVLVENVTSGSAADDAGIEVGDVIAAVDGEEMKDIGDLAATISTYSPGDEVELVVVRDGETSEVTAVLGQR